MSLTEAPKPGSYVNLMPGDSAPWFRQRTPNNPEFHVDTVGGRYIVLCFFGSSISQPGQAALEVINQRRAYFDDVDLCFFGVTLDPQDETERKLDNIVPGIRFFFDFDGHVSRKYGALPFDAVDNTTQLVFRPLWVVLDRMLRVVASMPFRKDGSDVAQMVKLLDFLPPFAKTPEPDLPPPVLILPGVFEPELCKHLISLYKADGGYDSGFMNAQEGKTLGVYNYAHKRRRDYEIQDHALIDHMYNIMKRRLLPEIARAFQYKVTHIERNIVACYSSEDGGHFNAHRDNTTPGTAHRCFAVTLNLNEEFEGGELNFPEFSKRTFRAPLGGVVVFSCAMLHAATVVTKGTRYAYLPFLYDEAAAKIRDANRTTIIEAAKK